ncbi:hypothetical protein A3K62_01760 [Candidatus Pacearchaeota archaeon RBG_16_35_8]|nr:MAG: hypothetical protein A3K62_01760 [Candidatus Pacearchaeota archaeon RBG_16_35_8]
MDDPQMKASVIYMGKVVSIKDLPQRKYDIVENDRDLIALGQMPEQIPTAIIQYFTQRGFPQVDISKKAVELNIRVKKSR